jgi:tetratricopeptide (TPR) repeat protein
MARKALGTSSVALTERFSTWTQAHREEIKIGAIGAAVAFFFTHGLPLWDDDYSQWLTQAHAGIFGIIKRILLPVTSEPQTWGYSDRPVQVLFYWVLSHVLGTWGTGWFLVKSVVFGGLVGTLYHWARKLGVERAPAIAAVALFTFCANVQASLIWHSDFGVYSQLVLSILLLWSVEQIEKGPRSVTFSRGLGGIPPEFKRFVVTFFVATYLGAKLKGDVRLAPLVLMAWLYLFKRERFKAYWAPFTATFLATLPWSGQLFRLAPPFLGGSGYAGWTYGSFNLHRVWEFIGADAFYVAGAPLSLVGASGILVALGLLAYGGYRAYQEKLELPDEKVGFFLTWMTLSLLACGAIASQNPTFQLRYTLIPMVPATLLIALLTGAAFREFGRVSYFKEAALAIFAIQCGIHLVHDYQHRRDMGHTVVAIDKIYRTIEEDHPSSSFVLMPGFLNYGYKVASDKPAITGRKGVNGVDAIVQANLPPGNTFAASWSSTLDPRMSVAKVATGCGASLFDVIFPCSATDGAVLLRFEGQNIPELTEGDKLDKAGNLAGAAQAYEGYLAKVPQNHGVDFILGLVYYRLGSYAKMEQVYDQFAPFFPAHTSVLYNWGLAKQGVQKYAEASKLLERAYTMAPKDYAIGFNLADSYMRMHRKGRALATLQELLKVYPNSDVMKKTYTNWEKDVQ